MTDRELAAIRARLERATPGPWEARDSGLERGVAVFGAHGLGRILYVSGSITPIEHDRANAALIANAPSDLAALLAEVDILRGLLSDRVLDSDFATEIERRATTRERERCASVAREWSGDKSLTFTSCTNAANKIAAAIIGLPARSTNP